MEKVTRKLLSLVEHLKMNNLSQKKSISYRSFDENIARKPPNLQISAFRREDESNQQLLRLYRIERVLIIDRIQIGTIYLRKWNGFNCFSNFS